MSEALIKKLKKVAKLIDADKGLHFFALVHDEAEPPDRWDVIVSAEKLVPWSTEAIQYIARLLRKELTDREIVQIEQVVPLPRDNELIKSLSEDQHTPPGRIRGLHPMDHFDEAVVIWSAKNASGQPAKV
jgi:hypothetical protein